MRRLLPRIHTSATDLMRRLLLGVHTSATDLMRRLQHSSNNSSCSSSSSSTLSHCTAKTYKHQKLRLATIRTGSRPGPAPAPLPSAKPRAPVAARLRPRACLVAPGDEASAVLRTE